MVQSQLNLEQVELAYSKLIIRALYFYALGYVFIALSTTATGLVTYSLYRVIVLVGGTFHTIGLNNLIFDLVSPEERTSALAINTIVSGLSGFFTTILFTPLVTYIQGAGNTFLGMNVYAQQVLGAISVVLYTVAIIFYHIACKGMLNKKGV